MFGGALGVGLGLGLQKIASNYVSGFVILLERSLSIGDMIVVDAHLEVDAMITVEAGHDIAVAARQRVLQRHRVLNLMTHVDPWRRPDLDHPGPR